MKFKSIVIILILVSSFSCKTPSQEELLCDVKWEMVSVKNSDTEISIPQNTNPWAEFSKNRKYVSHMAGDYENGTWDFTKNKDSIVILTDNEQTEIHMSIDILTSDELQLSYKMQGAVLTSRLKKNKTLKP